MVITHKRAVLSIKKQKYIQIIGNISQQHVQEQVQQHGNVIYMV